MANDLPSGAAWLIVDRLLKKYRPSDLMVEIELNRKLGET
jgi:hypothetical protein